jgi:glycerate-2-kinase
MTPLGEQAKKIFLEVLKRTDPRTLIERSVGTDGQRLKVGDIEIDLSGFTEVVVIGFGKASLSMGTAIEDVIGPRFTTGILVTDRARNLKLKSQILIANHPIPDQRSVKAAQRIFNLVSKLNRTSLILFLISGGGSSLVELPINDVTLEELQKLNHFLIRSGASIREINIIRKHLSMIKGGRLGYLARKCKCVGLYLSDVNCGDIRTIASNPLLEDDATLEEFYEIAARYRVVDQLTGSLRRMFESRGLSPLPARWYEVASEPITYVLAENKDAVNEAVSIAERHGFMVATRIEREERPYQETCDLLIARLLELKDRFPGRLVAVISGGEVSCVVRGAGVGGRNQEFVLYSASRLAQLSSLSDWAVFSSGSDGIDGNSNAAGAAGTEQTIGSADLEGLDVTPIFQSNDSHSFFKQTGGLLVTGPTGNNVRDLIVLLGRSATAQSRLSTPQDLQVGYTDPKEG